MRKISMLILLLVGIIISSTAENVQNPVDTSADHGLMVRQKPHSEAALIDFFKKNDKIQGDTLYSVIFRPANCPRCDILLNKISKNIRNVLNSEALLIAVYPDSLAAKDYIQSHKIDFDHVIYDTDERFNDFLSFSPGYLHVGYILKIDNKNGQLIVGSNADNVTRSFFEALGAYVVQKPQKDFKAGLVERVDKSENASLEAGETLSFTRFLPITFPDSLGMLSEIVYRPYFRNNDLLFNDKLALKVYHFKEGADKLSFFQEIQPTRQQAKMFSSIPDNQYQALLQSDQLKEMPISIFNYDNDTVGIVYSLPELWNEGKDTAYRNKPCFILRSLNDTAYSDIIPLNYEYDDDFYYPHFDMITLDKKIIIGAQRLTWPILYERSEYEGVPELDSFQDAFYQIPQPKFAIYELENDSIASRFGHLPEFAQRTKTGYSLASSVVDVFGDEFAYANIYDGKVHVSNKDYLECDDCAMTYDLFDINFEEMSVPSDCDLYSYTPMHLAKDFFDYYVNEIKITPERVYAVISSCSDPHHRADYEESFMAIIDRNTRERSYLAFPKNDSSERRIVNSLRRIGSTVEPFIVTQKSDGNWYVAL